MSPARRSRPADFALRYEWHAGTMPPPGHYEYTIQAGPDLRGEVVFVPDYPQHNPPIWSEEFTVQEDIWNRLYALLVRKGVLRKPWPEMDRRSVGGSLAWLEVTAQGQSFQVSNQVQGAEKLAEVFTAVRALVPEATWQKLLAQRDEFEQRYYQERG
jgi:hypothetical protein